MTSLSCRLVLSIVLTTSIWAAPVSASVSKDMPNTVRTDNGKHVSARDINNALIGSNLITRLKKGESFRFYDITFTAEAPSAVLLAASSEYLTAALLTGAIRADDMQAQAGQLLTWQMNIKKPQRFHYDMGKLLASSSPAIDEQLRSDMEPALRSQQRAIYWGKLQPAATNMQAPISPSLEAMRREYLQSPATVETRRAASGDAVKASKDVAEKFVAALARRDSATVAELLDPVVFKASDSDNWTQSRARFARKLTASSLPAKLKGYSLTSSGTMKWKVAANGKTFIMEQESQGAFPFVKKFEVQN